MKRRVHKCRTKFCRGISTPSSHSPFCGKCRARRWKAAHPIPYAWNKLKYRARERGHEFTLTVEDFAALWKDGLLQLRGRNGHCLSINRKDGRHGYHVWNVEIKTVSENARLRWVPFFKSREAEQTAISEVSKKIREVYDF